jgi:hypothetical protein
VYNVCCIVILPVFQRKGYGYWLIDFSTLRGRCADELPSLQRADRYDATTQAIVFVNHRQATCCRGRKARWARPRSRCPTWACCRTAATGGW